MPAVWPNTLDAAEMGWKGSDSEEDISAMAPLYSTRVTAKGGRHGSVRSEDGLLKLNLALPKSLGGNGGATNPEQLFAAGYSACFENAVLRASREARLPTSSTVKPPMRLPTGT